MPDALELLVDIEFPRVQVDTVPGKSENFPAE
jgi:hypothetical protein